MSDQHPFDADTAVSRGSDGHFSAEVSDRWNVGGGHANGGYALSICLRALAQTLPQPDPLVVSAFYQRRVLPGPVELRTELVRAGRRLATGEARLLQDGRELVRVVASFADLGQASGPTVLAAGAPALPPPEDCLDLFDAPAPVPVPDRTVSEGASDADPSDGESSEGGSSASGASDGGSSEGGSSASKPADASGIANRLECRMPKLPGWRQGTPSGRARAEFWMRLAGGRDADTLALPGLVDMAVPAVFELGQFATTTIELSVHVRARPAPGWMACRVHTNYLIEGYHEEDFEIWDSTGRLVAQSRQLALLG